MKNKELKTLMPKLRYYSIGGWGTYGWKAVTEYDDHCIVSLYSDEYKVEPYLDGYIVTATKEPSKFTPEIYSSIDDVAYGLFRINRKDYKPHLHDKENDTVWFRDLYFEQYTARCQSKISRTDKFTGEEKEVHTPQNVEMYDYQIPKETDGKYSTYRPDYVPTKVIPIKATPMDIARDYFPTRRIKDGWLLSFELNVYSNKVAHRTRIAGANAMIINPNLYYKINSADHGHQDKKANDIWRGYYDMSKYDWIEFDYSLPENIIVVYMNHLWYPGIRAFAITENGFAVSPYIENMGYILEIGDVSDHFGDR